MPQSQTAANPLHQEEEKKGKNIHAQNKQTNVREAQRPAPSSPSEVIRMLKQTEKRGQRAWENFKTPSAPWYKPQSYTELRPTPGLPVQKSREGSKPLRWDAIGDLQRPCDERRSSQQNALGVHDDLLTMVKKRKLRWYDHISRSSGMARTILEGKVKGLLSTYWHIFLKTF